MYKHNNHVSINIGEQRPALQKKKMQQINTARGHRIQKQQQILQLPPVITNYAENPEPILQKQNMLRQKYNPWTYITKTTTDITLSPCKHRLCRKY